MLEKDGTIVASTYLNIVPNMTRSASPYAFYRSCGFSTETKTAYHVSNPAAPCVDGARSTGQRSRQLVQSQRADLQRATVERPPIAGEG